MLVRRAQAVDAVQFGRIHLWVPSDRGAGLFRHRALEPSGSSRMARIGLAVLLRLVELGLRAAAGRLSRVQLCLRPSSCAIRAHATHPCRGRVARFRGRRQSAAAGILQVRKFPSRHLGLSHRQRIGHRPDRPSARHIVLHLHPDRVPRRRLSRLREGIQPDPLRVVRHLFSSPHRRPDPAPQGDDAAVPGSANVSAEP